ncbi:hypothetical protein N7457_001097 [Penicillium paradoxum]|uniref:uncharacterized protein n=1 Tax=Penicillium paradoxum TaxID=176176 RepID=UPI002549408C|nr:uncharacterized protein N7457_001097 [Penicillium paradoxum]KAJ5794498.1 hypothetical protein N7457_001097 [Penicillium paradoxum]
MQTNVELPICNQLLSKIADRADFIEFGNKVVSEAIEMEVSAPENQSAVDQWVYRIWRYFGSHTTPDGEWKIDYDADVPPPEKTAWGLQEIREILEQQTTPDYESEDLCLTWGSDDEKTLTVTNFTDSSESDLQYVMHVLFLAGNTDNGPLERTARIFSLKVLSRIASTRMGLEFRIPGPSLVSILSSPNPSKFPVVPNYGCKQFAVTLDQLAFITEPDVLFLIENIESKPEFGSSSYETIIRRSAGVIEAVRRLAMLDLKEKVGWDDVRYPKADEWCQIFGVLLEHYQNMVLALEPFEPYQP